MVETSIFPLLTKTHFKSMYKTTFENPQPNLTHGRHYKRMDAIVHLRTLLYT